MANATKPRRTARQQRAKATVSAILEATQRELVRRGFDRMTTNRIAEVAGVSVASLYQYFPSKSALAAALIDRHFEHVFQKLDIANAVQPGVPPPAVVRHLVESYLALFQAAPALHVELHACTSRVDRHLALLAARNGVLARISEILVLLQPFLRVSDTELASLTIVTLVESMAITAFKSRPDDLQSGRIGVEVTDVLIRYLFAEPSGEVAR